ncbi:hypothetical protein ATETN484_0015000400 [Aspergillus terreus]|nr:hypothetical protein ATETN484_0015000400 [Aspergillus terreus]
MSASKPTRRGPSSQRRNFFSPLDLLDQDDDEEVLPDPQSEEDDEQLPAHSNRYAHLALPQQAPENLPTPLLEGPVSPEKWTAETNRRFHIPGGFESDKDGRVDNLESSEKLEPDKHFVVRHSEPARDLRHKAPANLQSEAESLGKIVKHRSRRLVPSAPRSRSSLQAVARSVAPEIHALPTAEPSPGIAKQKRQSEDSSAKDRISGTILDKEGDRDVVTTSAREPLEGSLYRGDGVAQSGPSDVQPVSQSRRGHSPYGAERTVSSALAGRRPSHQISETEVSQGYQQKAYPPPSRLLEHTIQQEGRSSERERRAGPERSVTPSDGPEDGKEPFPEDDALPLPGQARRSDSNRLPSRDATQQSIRRIREPSENHPAPATAHGGVGVASATNTRSGFLPRSDTDRSGLNSRPPSTRAPVDQRRKQGPTHQDRARHGAPAASESTPGPLEYAFEATVSHPSRGDHSISSPHPFSQPTVYPSESEVPLSADVKDGPRVDATRPSGRHPDTLPIRRAQQNAGPLTPQTSHNDRDTHTNTDSGSRPWGILGKPQQPQTRSSAGKARMMFEDQSPPADGQRAGHQYNPASQPPKNMLAASDPDSHRKTTGLASSMAATNDAASHDAGRQQPSPPLGGDKSAGSQSYPLHREWQPIWHDDAFQQPQMSNAPIKNDPQDHREPPSKEQQGHARGQGVQRPREDQQKSDSIPSNIPTTDPAKTRHSTASKVDPMPKSSAQSAAGAGLNEDPATAAPATEHRTKKDPQETVLPSQKGASENKAPGTGRSMRDEQLQVPVSADHPDLNQQGDLDSSAPGAGTKAMGYATIDSDWKGSDLTGEYAQLHVISEEICSMILGRELPRLLEEALGPSLLSAFSALPTWRQDELCHEAVDQAAEELSKFADAVVSAHTDP